MKKKVNSWRCTLNERLKILKLLEDGKINSDEAARLLEALSQSETKHRKGQHRMWASIETIPEVIATAISTSFKHSVSKESLQFPRKKKIEFKGISGDLTITGDTKDTIEIEKEGFAKIQEIDDVLGIKAISGDIKIRTPRTTDFMIKGISGDLEITHLDGKIEIASVSGSIIGKELSGSFIGNFVSGDVDLDYQKVDNIKIKSKTSDITLRLDKKVEAGIEVETKDGEITCEFELKEEEKKGNWLKGVINKPKAKIEIKNEHGDIAIKTRR